jgi:hypothetical protein
MATVVTAAGCGSGLSTVAGTVTLDGVPIEGGADVYGTVSFFPQDGGGAPAIGIIQENGQYVVATGSRQGMEPGNYLIGVSVKRIHAPSQPGGLTRPEQISPPKYAKPATSGFRAKVKPGGNTFDFALNSKLAQ